MSRLMLMQHKVLLVLSGLLLAGCAADRPTYQAEDIDSENLKPVTTEYEIGPGDAIEIFVWDHADLSTRVEVRPNGRISTPLIEDLLAAGKTPTTAAHIHRFIVAAARKRVTAARLDNTNDKSSHAHQHRQAFGLVPAPANQWPQIHVLSNC